MTMPCLSFFSSFLFLHINIGKKKTHLNALRVFRASMNHGPITLGHESIDICCVYEVIDRVHVFQNEISEVIQHDIVTFQ